MCWWLSSAETYSTCAAEGAKLVVLGIFGPCHSYAGIFGR
ncbi:hypothetical protein HMPREF3198_00004 [Winkia neuii]|nr:hypothetical protein HMPREF3198_00004 [Winkia neuii]